MLFFSTRQKVGCLGKVPLASDFSLEVRLGGAPEEALSGWLHSIPKPEPGTETRAAFAALQAGGDPPDGRLPAAEESGGFGFILLDSRGRAGITGRLWPSRDAAGRPFPFALYIGLDRKALRSELMPLLGRAQSAWKALDSLSSSTGRSWLERGGWSPDDAANAVRALKEAGCR